MARGIIPRRLSIPTYTFLVTGAFVAWLLLRLAGGLLDANREIVIAYRELAEVHAHIGFAEGHVAAYRAQLDVDENVLTQCLGWQGRLSFEIDALRSSCLGTVDVVGGGL